jgi:hypothetical protein
LLRAEEYISEHYHLRYNRLSREHELCEREGGAAAWKVLDEALCCTLLMEMQHAGIGLSKPYLVRTVVRGYKQVAHYHPVCSYLDALPQWDGHDHIGDLFRRITHDEQLLLWLPADTWTGGNSEILCKNRTQSSLIASFLVHM